MTRPAREDITAEEVLEMLARACEGWGGQTRFAAQAGVKRQYVAAVLKRERPPSDVILRALGLSRAKKTIEVAVKGSYMLDRAKKHA